MRFEARERAEVSAQQMVWMLCPELFSELMHSVQYFLYLDRAN